MESRLLIGYALLAGILLLCTWGWRRLTRESRSYRRAHVRDKQSRKRRREERIEAERGT
jgi:hypothetical protein